MKVFSPKGCVAALAAIALGLTAQPVKAGWVTYNFHNEVNGSISPPPATITLYDNFGDQNATIAGATNPGAVVIQLQINTSVYTGDLFALYFNALPETLVGTLSFTKLTSVPSTADITGNAQVVNSVNSVDSVSSSTSINPLDGFDIGVAFGVQGANDGSILSIKFQVTSSLDNTLELTNIVTPTPATGPSSVDSLLFGLRVQSTGLGGSTNGSWKLYIQDGQRPDDGGGGTPLAVPAPAGIVLLASALPVLALRRLIRRKPAAA